MKYLVVYKEHNNILNEEYDVISKSDVFYEFKKHHASQSTVILNVINMN